MRDHGVSEAMKLLNVGFDRTAQIERFQRDPSSRCMGRYSVVRRIRRDVDIGRGSERLPCELGTKGCCGGNEGRRHNGMVALGAMSGEIVLRSRATYFDV